ncbi:hypothetical protein NBRC116494_24740 [Aurantivibrio plasticivorans]
MTGKIYRFSATTDSLQDRIADSLITLSNNAHQYYCVCGRKVCEARLREIFYEMADIHFDFVLSIQRSIDADIDDAILWDEGEGIAALAEWYRFEVDLIQASPSREWLLRLHKIERRVVKILRAYVKSIRHFESANSLSWHLANAQMLTDRVRAISGALK